MSTINPESLAESGTEHGHQTALFLKAQQSLDKYPELEWMYAVPNGGQRSASVAAALKAEGVKSGVSDICLPVQRCGYNGFYIEMKKPGALSKTSTKQKEFGAFVMEQDYLFAVFDHWEKAWSAITKYLDGEIVFCVSLEGEIEEFIKLL